MTKNSVEYFENALMTFDKAYSVYTNDTDTPTNMDITEMYRDSVIKRFEYTYELAWKLMQKSLFDDYGVANIKNVGRKDMFRHASQVGLLDDVQAWFTFHESRNKTTLVYDVVQLQEILNALHNFSAQCHFTLKRLKEINI